MYSIGKDNREPTMGIGKKFKYAANFSCLDSIWKEGQGDTYFAEWEKKYKDYLETADEFGKVCLGIRIYRVKKEVFSSAQMFTEAIVAKKEGCLTAYFFLCYYALFHAMESVLFMNTDLDDGKILGLSHRKVKKYFQEYYCMGEHSILPEKLIALFERLKTFREYYSYTMPLNVSGAEQIDMNELEHCLKLCYQLAHVHEHILFDLCKGVDRIPGREMEILIYFVNCCCKLNPDSQKPMMDDADQGALSELLRFGADYSPMCITIDHDFDEYGGYDSWKLTDMKIENTDIIRRDTIAMVYRAIC